MTMTIHVGLKGGAGSGNFAHAGRPGKLGGSIPKSSGAPAVASEIDPEFARNKPGMLKNTVDQIKGTEFGRGYFILPNGKLLDISDEFGGGTNDHVGFVAASSQANNYLKVDPEVQKKFQAATYKLMGKTFDQWNDKHEDAYMNALVELWDSVFDAGNVRVRGFKHEVAIDGINIGKMGGGNFVAQLQDWVIAKKLPGGKGTKYSIEDRGSNLGIGWLNFDYDQLMSARNLHDLRQASAGMKEQKIMLHVGLKGGAGSGNFGHSGRPGKLGGSIAKAGGVAGQPDPLGNMQEARYNIREGDFVAPPVEEIHKVPAEALDLLGNNAHADYMVAHNEENRSAYKDRLVTRLSEQTGLPYQDVNDFVAQWANSSNDTTYRSLSIQEAISKEFGVPLSSWQQQKIRELKHAEQIKPILQRQLTKADDKLTAKQDELYKAANEYGWGHALTTKLKTEHEALLSERNTIYNRIRELDGILQDKKGDGARAHIFQHRPNPEVDAQRLVRAMYDNQQAAFQAKGIKFLTLYRGTKDVPKTVRDSLKVGDAVTLKTNAAESYSAYYHTARAFSSTNHGLTIAAKVPVSRILTSPSTGLGCLSEFEFVVLGQRFSNADKATVVQKGTY